MLNYNGFRVGFEFEFIVPDICRYISEDQILKAARKDENLQKRNRNIGHHLVSQLSVEQIRNCLIMSDRDDYQTLTYMLGYLLRNDIKRFRNLAFWWGHNSKTKIDPLTPGHLVLALKLKPITGNWYRKINHELVNVTDRINNLVRNTDLNDPNQVEQSVREINRCRILHMDRLVWDVIQETTVINHVRKHLSEKLDIKIKSDSLRHYEVTKKKPDYYLVMEFNEDQNDLEHLFPCFELVTPPLPPDEAKHTLDKICKCFQQEDFITNNDTGVHINVSHPDVDPNDITLSYFALVVDLSARANRYGRTVGQQTLRKEFEDSLRDLSGSSIIGLDMLETSDGIRTLNRIVDIYTTSRNTREGSLENVEEYSYMEFQFAGGKDYPTKTDQLHDDVDEVLEIYSQIPHYQDNPEYKRLYRNMLRRFGCPDTQTPCLGFLERYK